MAYVPGFDFDLFFSYAQDDSAEWMRALERSLRQDLIDRLGPDVAIWKDDNNIRFGQKLARGNRECPEGIRRAPGYRVTELSVI